MAFLTNVTDGTRWHLAVPCVAVDGSAIDFSNTRLTLAITRGNGGAPIATLDTRDGSLTFVTAAQAYVKIQSNPSQRTLTVSGPTAVFGDLHRYPDPSSDIDPEWLGRIEFLVHPSASSSGIATAQSGFALVPAQPYAPAIETSPLVIGPQGVPATGNGLPPLPPDAVSKTYSLAVVNGVLTWVAAGSIGPDPDPPPGDLAPRLSLADPRNLLALRPLGLA